MNHYMSDKQRARGHRAQPRRGGQVLIITLIAMTMLVGLIFYVYNLGSIVNRRIAVQQAADSAAISGANWMARSMNVVAMNNCAQARCLALIPVMDALPLASAIAYNETNQWEICLSRQQGQTVNDLPLNRQLIADSLNVLHSRIATERDVLAPMDAAMNHSGFDMQQTTCWAIEGQGGTTPQGTLWQAAMAMEEMNEATAESAGALAQSNAVMFGQENGVESSMLVPVLPKMPARKGTFADFQPVLRGEELVTGNSVMVKPNPGSGGAISDAVFPHRLGPWARLFRWRDYIYKATAWEWVAPTPGAHGQTRGGGGSVPLGGRTRGGGAGASGGGSGGWHATEWELQGYHTFGPYSWALRRLNYYVFGNAQVKGHLSDTFFYDYISQLSNLKLEYMFGSQAPQSIHESNYVIDYPTAKAIVKDPNFKIYRTMFYKIEVQSSVPMGDSRWLNPGTCRTNKDDPLAIWTNGWADPEGWKVPKVSDHIWRDQYTYETTADPEIGIQLTYDESNNPVWHPVYVADWYVWGGIDVGTEVVARNPCNWSGEDKRPAPILLDIAEGDIDPYDPNWDEGVRRSQFSYLGTAAAPDKAPVWPARFSSASPITSVVAVGQAKVFNNDSWDLWTQDWQVQLTPVTQWADWAQRIKDGKGDVQAVKVLKDADVDQMYNYLDRLKDAAKSPYMNH